MLGHKRWLAGSLENQSGINRDSNCSSRAAGDKICGVYWPTRQREKQQHGKAAQKQADEKARRWRKPALCSAQPNEARQDDKKKSHRNDAGGIKQNDRKLDEASKRRRTPDGKITLKQKRTNHCRTEYGGDRSHSVRVDLFWWTKPTWCAKASPRSMSTTSGPFLKIEAIASIQ